MTELATIPAKQKKLRDFMFKPAVLSQIAKAVRTTVPPQTISRLALTAANRDGKLWNCTPESFAAAVVECCQLGLEPNSVSGEAYLIPYGNVCTLVPGYKGLIKLAYNSGQVASIASHNVYEEEPFTVDWGASQPISHTELPPSQRGEYKATYARIKIKGGEPQWELMWAEDVAKVQARAQSKRGPWSHAEDVKEMRRKTVLRKALKYVPKSATMERALALQDAFDTGERQAFIDVVPDSVGPPKPQLGDYVPEEPAQPPPDNGEQPEPDNSKLQAVMDKKKKGVGKAAPDIPDEPPAEGVDLKPRRDAIKTAWIAIPPEDRPGVLKNLTLKGAVKTLEHIDDIERVDSDADLEAVQAACVDAKRDF